MSQHGAAAPIAFSETPSEGGFPLGGRGVERGERIRGKQRGIPPPGAQVEGDVARPVGQRDVDGPPRSGTRTATNARRPG
jgi:hypothetical protein